MIVHRLRSASPEPEGDPGSVAGAQNRFERRDQSARRHERLRYSSLCARACKARDWTQQRAIPERACSGCSRAAARPSTWTRRFRAAALLLPRPRAHRPDCASDSHLVRERSEKIFLRDPADWASARPRRISFIHCAVREIGRTIVQRMISTVMKTISSTSAITCQKVARQMRVALRFDIARIVKNRQHAGERTSCRAVACSTRAWARSRT